MTRKGVSRCVYWYRCFDGMFSLQVKPDSKPYQAPPRHILYVLQKPFQEELEGLQQQDIITPLGVDEIVKWCNSFIFILKAKGKVRLFLGPARLNQVLIRPVHRGPTLNNIFPKLNNIKYWSLIDASSGYHNLKLDEISSYLTTFAYQFGRYSYKRLLFWAAPAGDMFQHKINKLFKKLPNVYGNADDILVVGYDVDGKEHEEMLWQVLQICRQVNLKLNKDKWYLRCTSVPFYGEVISKHGVQPNPRKMKVLITCHFQRKNGAPSISWYN